MGVLPVYFHFTVPLYVPLLAAAAVFAFMVGLRLRATATVFDLMGPRPSLREQVSVFADSLVKRYPKLAKLLGPEDVEERLALAGSPLGLKPEEFYALRLSAAGVAAVAVATGLLSGSIFALLPALVFKAPDWWLSYLITERRRKMKREFMQVASRLATALSGGLPVNDALEWAASGARHHRAALREELAKSIEKARTGTAFEKVLDEFATRTGLLDARRLATTVIQAQKFGGSIADKLAEAVRDARERRKAEIIGQAQSAERKLQVAVFVMALPTVFLTLAPMGITLMQQGLFGP
ncbi:type II secretion system F family protein [Desulfofundulus thermosubterraneus]|uniref:Type II secretion system (T2SS), protein F n=1 Tax=Desulfofundulus thermosubterraneus DSM 16057 TaxID=1121432 RepID=A0A1M6H2U5_9FIRM|nr:type II secretion system F family protein [Desulfofundulus thermosubterraneus]SHJ16462.1 Type II secretion system (T2SS), protein F [Desulfofundulus thermosubterraneus DSM 16057]